MHRLKVLLLGVVLTLAGCIGVGAQLPVIGSATPAFACSLGGDYIFAHLTHYPSGYSFSVLQSAGWKAYCPQDAVDSGQTSINYSQNGSPWNLTSYSCGFQSYGSYGYFSCWLNLTNTVTGARLQHEVETEGNYLGNYYNILN